MTVHRIVAHRMGGWRWGYPRGERRAIVGYWPGYLADGRLVWRSGSQVCSGLTACNEAYMQSVAPDAFAAPCGSIHHRPACLSIYAGVPVAQSALVG